MVVGTTKSTIAVWSLINLKDVFILCAVIVFCNAKNQSVIFLLAEGTNELEAVTTIYILRLAGFQVVVAGLNGNESVSCANGVVIKPDLSLEVASRQTPFDAVAFVGGEKASKLLKESESVGILLKEHEYKRRYIATSGSGPIVLDAHEIGYMKYITSAPQYKKELSEHYKYKESDIVVDGKLVTNRYSGKSMEFALSILNHMHSSKLAESVAHQLLPF